MRFLLSKFVLTAITVALTAFAAGQARAQIRIVSYNVHGQDISYSDDEASYKAVLGSMGQDQSNGTGVAKRVGIMALQEVYLHPGDVRPSHQWIAEWLNETYSVSSYQAVAINHPGDNYNWTAFVYDTAQVELLSTDIVDDTPRCDFRGQFRPVGYNSPQAEFYVYDSHFKAYSGVSERNNRYYSATQVRADGDSLGEGANIIYAGDFNFVDITGPAWNPAGEPGYGVMVAPGPGQGIDPAPEWESWLARSYSSTGPNSRIDFQFSSGELNDQEGLDLIDGSYHVFGPHLDQWNQWYVEPYQLALTSDHLPVMAEYQVPAVMEAVFETPVPSALAQGETYNQDFFISNIANVVAELGADELDYAIQVTGDVGSLIGSGNGTDLALGGGILHELMLDTSMLGMRSGSIIITSLSQGVQNGTIIMPISFEVVPVPEPATWMLTGIAGLVIMAWRRRLSR